VSAPSLFSDELVSQLMAVGQVDILVGVPTLDNAATVGKVVRALHTSFATHFVRERTVLINSDGGSRDGTPEIVRAASLREDETLIAPGSLRTIHRISAPYRGVPGKGAALRTLFAAADLLQARAVAVFDPDLASITPDWLPRLVRPVYEGQADFVAAAYVRHPLEGPLVTQLVRPLARSAYGRLQDPLAGEFACSGAFALRCLEAGVWDGLLGQQGVELWLPLEAMAAGSRVAQAVLGSRVTAPALKRPGLPEVFAQVVGTLFACLERHAPYWTARTAPTPVATLGELPPAADLAPAGDPADMLASFRSGVRDLAPLLEPILSPALLGQIRELALDSGAGYPDDLWAATVCRAAAAYQRQVMHRGHLVQALVPLYLGRAASFLLEGAGRDTVALEQRQEELEQRFEAARPDLLRGWTTDTLEVSHG
jgi:glucosylglycerate synthase